MDEQKIKEEMRSATKRLVTGVRVMGAVIDAEFPGCGHVAMEVLFEEVDKLRKHTQVGLGTNKCNKSKAPADQPSDELLDTVSMMASEDYKERFKAEFCQLKIRYDKLHKMCVKYEAGTLEFEPSCELALLKEQKAAMGNYLRCLEVRAQIEGVEL